MYWWVGTYYIDVGTGGRGAGHRGHMSSPLLDKVASSIMASDRVIALSQSIHNPILLIGRHVYPSRSIKLIMIAFPHY